MGQKSSLPERLVKPGVVIAIVVFVGYGVLLPLLAWRPPKARVNLPEAWPKGQDLPLTVTLSALHSNFDVASIRFYVDYYGSTAKGPEGLFYPVMLFEQRPRTITGAWQESRLTYPHTIALEVIVPFHSFAEQGLLGPGTLTGKVDVNYVAADPRGGKRMPGVDRMNPGMAIIPFTITIQE